MVWCGGRSGVVWREEWCGVERGVVWEVWCGRSSGVGGKGMIEGVVGGEDWGCDWSGGGW